MYFLILTTTSESTSVPICGLLLYRIEESAPNFTKLYKTSLILPPGSLTPVFSLPSEKVPAPPSPNWTLDSVSSSPFSQNVLTELFLSSTHCPRSKIIGFSPDSASFNAQNIPAGPNPTTTGLNSSVRLLRKVSFLSGNEYNIFS